MDESKQGKGSGSWIWWAAATSAQLAAGIVSYRRGCGGGPDGGAATMMPFKAFGVATLIVGAGATAAVAALQATGLRTVNDMKDLGADIRRWSRAPTKEKLSESISYNTAEFSKE